MGVKHCIVVGAGVIGSSVAYYLSREGVKVTLLDKGYPTYGASGSCDQMTIAQSKTPNEHLLLALESIRMFKTLDRELNADIEFEQKGGMVLIENEEEFDVMKDIVQKQKKLGLDIMLIEPDKAIKRQPGLRKESFIASTYSPVDGEVNPFRLTLAFIRAAERNGAQFLPYHKVLNLRKENGRVIGVNCEQGVFEADMVVNACGAWSPFLSNTVDVVLPIKPRRGQIFISEAVLPIIHHCTLNARYIVAKHSPELLTNVDLDYQRLGVGLSLTQSKKGNVMFGSTREYVGYNCHNTWDGLRTIMRHAFDFAPFLRNLKIIRAMGGVRPRSPDGMPLIGPVAKVPGYFLATGHEGDGICLAPASGKLAADLILHKRSKIPAAGSFLPSRFGI